LRDFTNIFWTSFGFCLRIFHALQLVTRSPTCKAPFLCCTYQSVFNSQNNSLPPLSRLPSLPISSSPTLLVACLVIKRNGLDASPLDTRPLTPSDVGASTKHSSKHKEAPQFGLSGSNTVSAKLKRKKSHRVVKPKRATRGQ